MLCDFASVRELGDQWMCDVNVCKDAVDSFHTTCSGEAYNDDDTFENFSLI